MFYVHTYLGTGYKLVDFTTGEEQTVKRDEIINRVEKGETIIGVCIDIMMLEVLIF